MRCAKRAGREIILTNALHFFYEIATLSAVARNNTRETRNKPMIRSIPPRTRESVRKARPTRAGLGGRGFNISISRPSLSESRFSQKASTPSSFKGKAYKRPRQWRYITKPFFKRIKEPIVDVFKEAQEVQIIIDLGNFSKGELNFGLKSGNYLISGIHENIEFKEEIPLPYDVDIKKIKEIFRNDILEIILPKKKTQKRGGRKNEKKTSNFSNR